VPGNPVTDPQTDSFLARLKAESAPVWAAYLDHEFVRRLADGSLPEACFRHYLTQDYLFLVHFSRAYALAVYKADDLDDMRQAAATLDALLNAEMTLHLRTCARWGLSEKDMAAIPEADANLAYTRFVLDTGMAGDLLDLLVALAPCVLGYGEIGARLLSSPSTPLEATPYRDWIETYGGSEYQDVAAAAAAQIERVARRRLGDLPTRSPRWTGLSRTFRTATRLEIGFWDMGLAPAESLRPPRAF
jgi:thiaminase (transcriptional activator TenA)